MVPDSSPKKPSIFKKKLWKFPVWLYLVAAFLVFAIAAGSGGNSSDSSTTPASQGAATAQAATTQEAADQAATTQEAADQAATTQEAADQAPVAQSCTDSSNPDVLQGVTVTQTDNGLDVAWTTTGTSGTVLWSITVQNPDFTSAYQIGVKTMGVETVAFVFDLLALHQEYLDGEFNTTLDGATVTVPWASLPGLETGTVLWRAGLSVDGTDVASCPAPGDDPLAPPNLTLGRD